MNKIRLLEPLISQRIAAGEVVERPASIVRELVDNAVDAHAHTITVQVEQGGLKRITVVDDGDGITQEDLALCCQSHATSKIATLEDLYHITTMGFRGEALASIAACSRVTIASSATGNPPASILVDNGKTYPVTPGGPQRGTQVIVEDLFATIPARRLFLKRPSTETLMCRNALVEKAMAFPNVSFRFYDADTLKLDLPASSPYQRVLDALQHDPHFVSSEMIEMTEAADSFSLYAVASTPACYRTDRSQIRIYVNSRPIDDYSLVQAVTYGYQEFLPGGAFPYCCLFITVDAELVDFNIHPTKREAKLRNKTDIHHHIITMLRSQLTKSTPAHISYSARGLQPLIYESVSEQAHDTGFRHSMPVESTQKPADPAWFTKARQVLQQQERTEAVEPAQDDFHYIGQLFQLFLVVEQGTSLYLIDQHAAHERILYDEIRSTNSIQPLLVPIPFEVERDVDEFLDRNASAYREHGLQIVRTQDLQWELHTIPAHWKSIESEVIKFISSEAGNMEELEKRLYATLACRTAIKEGDVIDRLTAESLIRKVLALEHPVCPHGRNFIVKITQKSLFEAVGRIIT